MKRIFAFFLTLTILTCLCGCSVSAQGLTTLSTKKTTELTLKGEAFWEGQKENRQLGEAVTVTDHIYPLSYALQYPQTGYPATDERIEGIVAEFRNAFEQEYLPEEGAEPTESTLLLGYEAYLTDNDHLSLVFFQTQESNDTLSPHTRIQVFHFDLTEDREVAGEELMWEGFREKASAYTQAYFTSTEPYSQRMFGNYKTLLEPEAGRFDRFAFTADGVLFYFDRFDLFPGSMGIVRLTVPYEELRGMAEPPETPAEPSIPENGRKMVALTFDDGPNPIHTNAILDILEEHKAKATFFDLGELVERYPDVVKREAALGCEVGSHSYDHDNFNKLTEGQIADDIRRTEAAFQAALGESPALFRPPYGACDENVKTLIPMPIALWSVDTLDWKSRDAGAILAEIDAAGDLDGKVILLHGIYASTAEATAKLVPALQEAGYELVTVSELIEAKHGETPEAGKIYNYAYFQ